MNVQLESGGIIGKKYGRLVLVNPFNPKTALSKFWSCQLTTLPVTRRCINHDSSRVVPDWLGAIGCQADLAVPFNRHGRSLSSCSVSDSLRMVSSH